MPVESVTIELQEASRVDLIPCQSVEVPDEVVRNWYTA
jgi:hypothetical protein